MNTPKFKVGQRVWTTWLASDQWTPQKERPFNRRGKKLLVTILGRKKNEGSQSGTCYRVRVPKCCGTCGAKGTDELWLDTGWFLACKAKS